MVLKNGEIANVDEVLNLVGTNFKNQAQLLYNSAYIGFNSNLGGDGVPHFKNIIYDKALKNTYYSWGTCPYSFAGANYSQSWTGASAGTGSVGATSEGAYKGYVYANINSGVTGGGDISATSNGTTPITVETGSYIYESALSSNYSLGNQGIYIYDGTNSVAIQSRGGVGSIGRTVYRLNINKTGKTARLTTNLGDTTATGINLSALNNSVEWYIRLRSWHTNTAYNMNTYTTLYQFSKLTDTTPNEFIIDLGTTEEEIRDCIFTWNTQNAGVQYSEALISADGTNYEEVTDATIHRFTNTGTTPRLKILLTSDNNLNMTRLTEYALLYNVGAA